MTIEVEIAPVARSAGVGARVDARSVMYLAGMGLTAVYFLAWPIWRAQFPLEIWFTEGWNAYLQDAAGTFAKLYPAVDSLAGNNYPPLSFYAVGLLARLTGIDSLYVGRALSIIGLLGVAADIFLAARILTRRTVGPAIGALWYVAIMAHNSAAYVGANDPQIAGEAIMGAALVMFLARDADGRSALPALLLMVLGGFWKHNMIAIPLTSMAWLLMRRGPKGFASIFNSGMAAVAGLLACYAVFGPDFFPDLLTPRAYGWGTVIANVGHLQWCALAFAIWATWAVGSWGSKPAHFTTLHIAIALGATILQWTGDGVSGNAEFDLILALGIGVGVAFARIQDSSLASYIRANYLRDGMVILLLARLVVTGRQETALVLSDANFRHRFDVGAMQVVLDAAAVAAIPGDVYCTNDIVCRIAGKPYVVDDFKIGEMQKMGRLSPDGIDALLTSHHVTAFKNDPRTFAPSH